jgi:hypothetical protein
VVPSKNQWWKVWSQTNQGKEVIYYYQFQLPFVYWYSETQYDRRSQNGPPGDPGQRGRWETDKEWLYISWLDRNGVPYLTTEQWDMPLFDERQTGIQLSPGFGRLQLRARILDYWEAYKWPIHDYVGHNF